MSSPLSAFKSRKPKKKSKRKKRHWQSRPLKRLARWVLFNNRGRPAPTRIVTRVVPADFRYANEMGWNSSIGIEGGPGEGKTETQRSWALLWTSMTGGKLKTTWKLDKIPDLKTGDWLMIDEYIIAEGRGKIQSLNRVKNLWGTLRWDKICIGLNTPALPELPFATFFATTVAQERTFKENMVEIRVPLPRYGLIYVGNAIVPLHGDEELRKEYEEDASKAKGGIKDSKGLHTIDKKVDVVKATNYVIEWAQDNGYDVSTVGRALSVVKVVAKQKGWDVLGGADQDIAQLVSAKKAHAAKISSAGVDYEGQTADLQQAVVTQLANMGFKNKVLEYLKCYFKKWDQTDVARHFGVKQGTISGDFTPFREGKMGYAFEQVYAKRLKDEGKAQFTHIGGDNTPAPDLVTLTKDLDKHLKELHDKGVKWWNDPEITKDIKEVYSLKCYMQKRTTVSMNRNDLAISEIALLDQGKPLFLVFYDIMTDTLFQVEVKDQERFKFKPKRG